ncbi:MAG TPA: RecX family transcriptional regulator [Sphingobium sp.]|nr:RecX family transcriptional regulator [Sphingobium sp.]
MPKFRQASVRKALNSSHLEALALHYAGRYATSRAKLTAYLDRKLRERGWEEDGPPPVAGLVERMAALGYVDDAAFATARGTALVRRGYGPRRVAQALDQAGIEAADRAAVLADTRREQWRAADTFARRRRIGPYGTEPPAREDRQKQIAAFVRAGHDFATAALWVDCQPGAFPEQPGDWMESDD